VIEAIQLYSQENPSQGFDEHYAALRTRGRGFGKCRL
jgi:hypothetical protein